MKHGHMPGHSRTPTAHTYDRMKQRVLNPNHKSYSYYGGRGVEICEHWKISFSNFLADMGERPVGMTLDRIDPEGNYEPSNCRWATAAEQGQNKRKKVKA